jgi:cobalt/nickel transport system permease protein
MLWAVHIANNVLTWPWELGGFIGACALVVIGAWRLKEDEIPRVALMTAAFFVASSMHVPLGPASVHLLLNGLVGVVLGWRAAPAIFVGLVLQAALIGHGGYTALGVNACILTVPALVSWLLFRGLNRMPGLRSPAVRAMLVAGSCGLWLASLVLAVALLGVGPPSDSTTAFMEFSALVLLHPVTIVAALAVAVASAWMERRLENAPEFPLGLLIGEVAVLLTVALNCTVLTLGGAYFGDTPPRVLVVAHLPIAALEGVLMGFTVGFIAKVKPALLGLAGAGCASR